MLIVFLAIFGYGIVPDHSRAVNEQNLSLKYLKPITTVYFIQNDPNLEPRSISDFFFGSKEFVSKQPIESVFTRKDSFYYKEFRSSFWQSKPKSQKISTQIYLLGADALGRDIFSRLVISARISLMVGLFAVVISLIIGIVLGVLGGYYGGRVDVFIQWVSSVFWAIPTTLLAMVFIVGFKGSNDEQIWLVFLAVGLTLWLETARLIRGLFLQYRKAEFIEATHALGYHDLRIIFRHILPNTIPTLIVISVSNFASAILMESGLSYLGLGVQPPSPSWGSMLREYYAYLGTDLGYMAFFPGICMMLSVFAFFAIGAGLRDAFDVRV
jgi:peptide/nickel transport system permease protein